MFDILHKNNVLVVVIVVKSTWWMNEVHQSDESFAELFSVNNTNTRALSMFTKYNNYWSNFRWKKRSFPSKNYKFLSLFEWV